MHRDLSAHLHTDECNKLIQALFQCRKENPYMKFFGACNAFDNRMTKCLTREMNEKRRLNKEKAEKRLKQPYSQNEKKYTIFDKINLDED